MSPVVVVVVVVVVVIPFIPDVKLVDVSAAGLHRRKVTPGFYTFFLRCNALTFIT